MCVIFPFSVVAAEGENKSLKLSVLAPEKYRDMHLYPREDHRLWAKIPKLNHQ